MNTNKPQTNCELTKETLIQLYLVENLSKKDAANKIGCNLNKIHSYCKKYDIVKSNELLQEQSLQNSLILYNLPILFFIKVKE